GTEPQSAARGCPGVPAEQDAFLRLDHPDVVVWWDRWSLSGFVGPDGGAVQPGTPAFWRLRSIRLDQAVRRLTSGGARVLFVGTEPPGTLWRTDCAQWCAWRQFLVAHYDELATRWNSMLERYAATHPGLASYLSITTLVCRTD